MESFSVTGSAVVSFFASAVTPPATNVKVVPLADLIPLDGKGISEKTVCDAKIRSGRFPCLVLDINTCKTLDQLRKKVADNEEDYEEAALRWLKELGVPVSGSQISPAPMTLARNNTSILYVDLPQASSISLAQSVPHNVLPVKSEARILAPTVKPEQTDFLLSDIQSTHPEYLENKPAVFQNGDASEPDLRQAYSPADEEKLSTVSEPITPPSASHLENHTGKGHLDGDTMQKLYIGHLPRDTTETEIRELFGNFGTITDIQIMADQKSDRYFAFLTYETEGMVDVAQKNRPHTLHNQDLKTQRVYPRKKALEEGALSCGTQVFVHGVKDHMTEQELADYFGRYGTVVRVEIPNNKATGKRMNYGFITFNDYDAVDKIVLTGEHNLKSCCLQVKKVNPDSRPPLHKTPFSPPPSQLSPSPGSVGSSSLADVIVDAEYTNYNGWETRPGSQPAVSSDYSGAGYGQTYQGQPFRDLSPRSQYPSRGRGGASTAASPMRPAFSGGRGRFGAAPYPARGGYSSNPRGRGVSSGFRR